MDEAVVQMDMVVPKFGTTSPSAYRMGRLAAPHTAPCAVVL